MWQEFLSEYGSLVISTILTAVLGAIGVIIKNLYQRVCNDKAKKDAAKTCVLAVEQLYKDLHGQEKYDKAVANLREMLDERGITITDLEIKMLIEAEVKKMNLWKGEDDE